MRLLWLLIAAFAFPQASSQVEFGSVEGVVTDWMTKQPIAGVQVSLILPASGRPSTRRQTSMDATTVTDGSGRFVFARVVPGYYELNIQRDGYFRSGASSPLQAFTTSFSVAAKQQVVGKYSLEQGGTISGRVLDPDRKPMVGVPVGVFQVIYTVEGAILGNRTSALSGGAGIRPGVTTNDKGEYRLFWLPPGEYYVRAEVDELQQARDARGGVVNSTAGYFSTFYPSAASRLTGAVPIVVRGGSESSATDITMQKPKTYAVSGRILLRASMSPRAPTARGVPTETVRYFVFPRGDEILETRQNHLPIPLSDEFQIPGLLPGSYDLVFSTRDNLWGKVAIDVVDRNLDGVVVEIVPNVTLKARIVSEIPIPQIQRVRLRLSPLTPGYPIALSAATGLEIPNVPPGRYKVLVQQGEGPGIGGYIADIREGSRSLNDGIIEANLNTQPLEVIFRAGGGSIAGVVRGASALGISNLAFLVPQPPRRQSWFLYKRVSVSSRDGSFTFVDVAPGQYRLFARPLDEIDANGPLNEQFLWKYESRANLVTVSEGGRVSGVELDLIPREFR